MCFSPEASFTASGVLLIAGIIAVKESKFTVKLPFAVIPLLFAVQQFSEGVLWLALQHTQYENWQRPATIFFLIFAQVVWPFWVPLSIFLIEKKQPAKDILKGLTIIGSLLSIFLLYRILTVPAIASIDCSHIYYSLVVPEHSVIPVDIIYLILTVISPFISTVKRTNLLGILIIISLAVSELFYTKELISVWCFFAAILSVVVIFVLRKMPKILQ